MSYEWALKRIRLFSYIDWWLTGLSYLLPRRLHQLLFAAPSYIVIKHDKDQIDVKQYDEHKDQVLDSQSFQVGQDAQREHLLAWLRKKNKRPIYVILLLTDAVVLKKQLSLPAAVRPNLRQALGFELGRITPFPADQIYYDYSLSAQDHPENRLSVDVFLVPRKYIDPTLEEIRSLGISIDAIKTDIQDQLNLMPFDDVEGRNNCPDKVGLALLVIACILSLALLYMPVFKQQQRLQQLTAINKPMQKDLVQLKRLREQQQLLEKKRLFIKKKGAVQLLQMQLLDELSRIIPDHTSVSDLEIKKDEVYLRGQSDNAAAILRILDSSSLLEEAEFKAPLTKNAATKKDRFHIAAKINGEKI